MDCNELVAISYSHSRHIARIYYPTVMGSAASTTICRKLGNEIFVWDTANIHAEVKQHGQFCTGDTQRQYILLLVLLFFWAILLYSYLNGSLSYVRFHREEVKENNDRHTIHIRYDVGTMNGVKLRMPSNYLQGAVTYAATKGEKLFLALEPVLEAPPLASRRLHEQEKTAGIKKLGGLGITDCGVGQGHGGNR